MELSYVGYVVAESHRGYITDFEADGSVDDEIRISSDDIVKALGGTVVHRGRVRVDQAIKVMEYVRSVNGNGDLDFSALKRFERVW